MKHFYLAFVALLSLTAGAAVSSAGVAEGRSAIQAQLPPGVTPATATHAQILQALEQAAEADPDRAVDIASAVMQDRWPVLNGDHSPSAMGASDGKSVVDSKSVVALDDEGKSALLIEMANAIINGATPDGQTPDPVLVSAVLQAMMFALPADLTGIGALLYEGVLSTLPPGVVTVVTSSLRADPSYQFTTPPGAVVPPGGVLTEDDDDGPGPGGPGPGPGQPSGDDDEVPPRPTPNPVTPVVNN